jgi:hypothetical protein
MRVHAQAAGIRIPRRDHPDQLRRRRSGVAGAAHRASHRTDGFIGVQELFLDYHFATSRNATTLDSVCVDQPFADFRGFLFRTSSLASGSSATDNNRFQQSGGFWRIEKDTNSA